MMKKRTFLIAVASALTAFSGNHAQAQVYTPPTTGLPQINTMLTSSAEPGLKETGWSYKSILWNGEYPRVSFGDATLDLKGTSPFGEILGTDLFGIGNYGGFLNTQQDALGSGLGLGKSPWVDSFTYLYQEKLTSGDKYFRARINAGYGEEFQVVNYASYGPVEQSTVVKGKVGLMLRSTLACDSPYVMMAVTNELGPQFSYRSRNRAQAQAAAVSTANSFLTKFPGNKSIFHVRLFRTGTTVTGQVAREFDDGTIEGWRTIGQVLNFPAGNCYVGFAAAANTAAVSNDPARNGKKQYQFGEFERFSSGNSGNSVR